METRPNCKPRIPTARFRSTWLPHPPRGSIPISRPRRRSFNFAESPASARFQNLKSRNWSRPTPRIGNGDFLANPESTYWSLTWRLMPVMAAFTDTAGERIARRGHEHSQRTRCHGYIGGSLADEFSVRVDFKRDFGMHSHSFCLRGLDL